MNAPLKLSKAAEPIVVTDAGILIAITLLQPLNALSLIVVIAEPEKVMLVNPEQL